MAQQQEKTREQKIQDMMRGAEVMKKVEGGNFKTGNIDETQLQQDIDQAVPQGQAPPQAAQPSPQGQGVGMEMDVQQQQMMQEGGGAGDITKTPDQIQAEYEQSDLSQMDENERQQVVENSNLPDNVKKAMLKNPTPKPDPSSVVNSDTFTMEDVKKHVQKKQQAKGGGQTQQSQSQGGGQQMMQEQMGSSSEKGMITEDKMRNIVKEEFISLLFKQDLKDSLIKEVKEEAVKEAIRDIKEKIKKNKKSTTATTSTKKKRRKKV